jgi:hypothetical protein
MLLSAVGGTESVGGSESVTVVSAFFDSPQAKATNSIIKVTAVFFMFLFRIINFKSNHFSSGEPL